MRKIRFSVACSVDGYIAGPHGEYDWIVMDPDIDFPTRMGRFDTILLGRRTYELMRTQGGGGGSMPGVSVFVFSRTLQQEQCEDATVSDDVRATVERLRKMPGKDIWLFGGGELFRSMLELGLVDSVELAMIPVLLGGGIPLLPPPARQARLRLTSQQVYPKTGTVMLEYAPV